MNVAKINNFRRFCEFLPNLRKHNFMHTKKFYGNFGHSRILIYGKINHVNVSDIFEGDRILFYKLAIKS